MHIFARKEKNRPGASTLASIDLFKNIISVQNALGYFRKCETLEKLHAD